MKDKKHLKQIADKIIKLENACQNSDNISKNMSIMENEISNLSFEDILELMSQLEERQNEINVIH
jgi:hypothetical protein